jgi:hypothetical protein
LIANRRGVELNGDFRQDVHASNLGGQAKLAPPFLDADDGRLAADPVFFTRREFGREDQNQFDIGSLLDAGLRIKINAVSADIASMGVEIDTLRRANTGRNAGGNSRTGAALALEVHRAEVEILYTKADRQARASRGSGIGILEDDECTAQS